MKQKFIKLTIPAVITIFQQWVIFWGGNQNCKILQWQYESFIASFRSNSHCPKTTHKAREIQQAVEKELIYLFNSLMKPVSIIKNIDYNALEKFIELIHNTPYLSKLSSFDMSSEELARLCGRIYLSDEHLSWVKKKLSSMQSDVLCNHYDYFQNWKIKNQFKISSANKLVKWFQYDMSVRYSQADWNSFILLVITQNSSEKHWSMWSAHLRELRKS